MLHTTTNTAASGVFSEEEWDVEEPTVVDREPLRCRIPVLEYLVTQQGPWGTLDDAALVASLSGDLQATSSELPAVTV